MAQKTITNADRHNFLRRALVRCNISAVRALSSFAPQTVYMKLMVKTLQSYGMNITGMPIYIAPNAWFDPTDYSLITIGENVVISRNVSILTHDYSISRIRDHVTRKPNRPEVALVRNVRIGNNSFVGFGAILMPGTEIGENCIIGSGSVVRGIIPDGSLVTGNPGQVVGSSIEWGTRKLAELNLLAVNEPPRMNP